MYHGSGNNNFVIKNIMSSEESMNILSCIMKVCDIVVSVIRMIEPQGYLRF